MQLVATTVLQTSFFFTYIGYSTYHSSSSEVASVLASKVTCRSFAPKTIVNFCSVFLRRDSIFCTSQDSSSGFNSQTILVFYFVCATNPTYKTNGIRELIHSCHGGCFVHGLCLWHSGNHRTSCVLPPNCYYGCQLQIRPVFAKAEGNRGTRRIRRVRPLQSLQGF